MHKRSISIFLKMRRVKCKSHSICITGYQLYVTRHIHVQCLVFSALCPAATVYGVSQLMSVLGITVSTSSAPLRGVHVEER